MPAKTNPPHRLLHNIPEVARSLGVSKNFVRDFIAKGDLPHVRLGRRVMVSDADLAAFVRRHRSRS